MEAYKCVKCGVISPLTDSRGQPLSKDRKCFRCGEKRKMKVKLPNFVRTKKGKRRRFGSGPIMRIGL